MSEASGNHFCSQPAPKRDLLPMNGHLAITLEVKMTSRKGLMQRQVVCKATPVKVNK